MKVLQYLEALCIEPLLDIVQLSKQAPSKFVHQGRQGLDLRIQQ